MISRIDHIAIAVQDYEKAFSFFTDVLGAVPGTGAKDDNLNYRWQNLALGDLSRLELLTPAGEGSFLDRFLAKKKGGVHHITIQTPDIEAMAAFLDSKGIPYFDYHKYGNVWKELFIHPRDAFGLLIQVAEFNADDWVSPLVKMPEKERFQVEAREDGCVLKAAHPGGGTVTLEMNREEAELLIDRMKEAL